MAFSNVGATDGAYTIKDKIFDKEVKNRDKVFIFNAIAYNIDIYQYSSNYSDGKPAWIHTDSDSGEKTVMESFTVNPGDNVIYYPQNAEMDISISGQVADPTKSASRTFNVDFDGEDENSYTFPFVNPFPVATTVGMLKDFIKNRDQILVWNDFAYNFDILQYSANYSDGKPAWIITDSDSGEKTIVQDDDGHVLIPACRGGTFLPQVGGVRVWTVTLSK